MARVMVVEDEDVLLEMIAALVEDLGYEALIATNGYEALQALFSAAEPPALIISDVMMPRMNGIEFTRAVKQDARLCRVPVILMSAAGRPRVDVPADYFVPKPFELDTLAALIEYYVNGLPV